MSMPERWIDELFRRLTVRYGAAFMRQYDEMPMAEVKADWAALLGAFNADDVRYALENLPTDRAPNAMQFRDLCRRAPVKAAPMLSGPKPKPNPGRVAELLERMKASKPDPKRTIDRLKEIAAERPLTQAQKATLAQLEAGHVSREMPGDFRPIPAELCPWNRSAA